MNIPTVLQAHFISKVSPVVVACAIGFLLVSGCSPRPTDAAYKSVQHQISETYYRLERAAIVDRDKVPTSELNFRLLASGSEKARIVDQDRKVLMTAPPNGTIFNIQMSSNQEQILIYYGDAKYQVFSADALDPVTFLPVKPPGQNDATGFSWHFLDDDHFLGSASLPSKDTAGKTMAEIEGLSPRAVLLYVYALRTGRLSSVEVDESLPAIFFIYDTSGRNVTLLTYDDDLVGAQIVRTTAVEDTNPP